MNQLYDSHVATWTNQNGAYLPLAIDLSCHSCARTITFANLKWQNCAHNLQITACKCPACPKLSTFLLFRNAAGEQRIGKHGELYVKETPSNKTAKPEILASKEISDSLRRAYLSATNVYNSQEWVATSVLSRRLLEGVTKSVAPENSSKSLNDQIKKLAEKKDLDKPITLIADAVRKGGNLGAHFDLEKEPTPEVARLMLELVEELLEYFFVLPERITDLHDEIDALSKKKL